jgi:hypothetical protein
MRTDITRDSFHAAKNFSRVLMQQGRVQLDADWNEQISILLHYLRALAVDVVGESAGPNAACGFELIVDPSQLPSSADAAVPEMLKRQHALIGPGRYYVDGLLVENREFVSFFNQPHFKSEGDASAPGLRIQNDDRILIYLDVWERQVTFVDDDSIREKALGGPDTATRAQVVWRVRKRDLTAREKTGSGPNPCAAIRPGWEQWKQEQRAHRGKLHAKVDKEEEENANPCVASAESIYRGVENQLYRVEIHHEGEAWNGHGEHVPPNVATFKWSRDNGSVFAAWLDQEGEGLTIAGLHDRTRGFECGQWIELSDDRRELIGKPGKLVKVSKLDGDVVTIEPGSEQVDRTKFSSTAVARRWDQRETEETKLHKGAIPLVEGQWFTLEDGVQIYFDPAATTGPANRYRTGDYWMIPARVATKEVEWPQEKDSKGKTVAAGVAPHGVTHHYAPLGILSNSVAGLAFEDCRCRFDPLPCVHGYPFDGEGVGLDNL